MISQIVIKKFGESYLEWTRSHPIGQIPKQVAKEGAGENRIPFAHLANSLPTYFTLGHLLSQSKKTSAKVLDVGCGTGRNISFLMDTLKLDFDYFGVDYSKACIAYAKKQYKKPGVQFAVYSNKLPFKTSSLDFVVSSHVLEHIKTANAQLFLTEIIRVLKPGGQAVIGTPNRKYCQDLFHPNPTDEIKYRLILPHEHEYYRLELKTLIKSYQNKFTKFTIYQTQNNLARAMMKQAVELIKPKGGLIGKSKYLAYSALRRSSKLQDLMAKVGTELLLRRMQTNHLKLTTATKYLSPTTKLEGDNLLLIIEK